MELRAGRHGPLHNLGVAYRRLGDRDEALRYLDQAAAVRPHFWNTIYTLAQVHTDAADFEKARDYAAQVPESIGWRYQVLLANIELREAYDFADTDRARCQELSGRAVDAFELAIELTTSERRKALLDVDRALADSLRQSDRQVVVARFLDHIELDPENPYHIANLSGLIPATGLNVENTRRLRQYLRTLAWSMSPGDARFRAQQERVYELLGN